MLRVSRRLIDVSGMRDVIQRRIPVMTLDSKVVGPVVWLTACIHGDEPGGTVIIHEVFESLRKAGLERGVVHALPLINSTGFENVSRFLNAEREDLNRCFPGNDKGTSGERIARRIFDLINDSEPTVVIDLHNDWIQSVPYVVIEPDALFEDSGLCRRTVDLAVATNLLVVKDSELDRNVERTLSGALVAHGVSAFTVEAGGACGIVESSIAAGKAAILGVLQSASMLPSSFGQQRRNTHARVLDYTSRPLCTSAGIIRFLVAPGDEVESNQELGRVYSAFGHVEESLRAARPGYVLGVSDHARALPGTEVIAIAEFDRKSNGAHRHGESGSREGTF